MFSVNPDPSVSLDFWWLLVAQVSLFIAPETRFLNFNSNARMEKSQSKPEFEDVAEKWTRVDLILDEICKNLPVADLKQVRLISKSFCEAASKLLARKTLIRLTGIVDLRPAAEKVSALVSRCLDVDYFFECQCNLDEPKDYLPIATYMDYLERAEFESGLIVKNVSVLSSSDVWLLPESHFSRLEQLQVVTFRPSEGLRILVEFPRLFPNLKKLELKYIQRDVGDGETGTRNWTSMPIEDDKEQRAEIQLEDLAITVAAYWAFVGSSVFQKLHKLKTLKLLWCGKFPEFEYYPRKPIRFNEDGELFGEWLQGLPFGSTFSKLNHVSFRFDLTPGNFIGAQQVLKTLKLEKLSLELYGSNFEFSQFILGLTPDSITALKKVHWGVSFAEHVRTEPVTEAVSWLCDQGFFNKSEWELTFRSSGDRPGWYSLTKTKTQLTQHRSGDPVDYHVLDTVISKLPQLASMYNYKFRRFRFDLGTIKYDHEKFQPAEDFYVSDPYSYKCAGLWPVRTIGEHRILSRTGLLQKRNCTCPHLCRKSSRLLCEAQKFLDTLRVAIPHEHLRFDYPAVTDVFCYVPPARLKKVLAFLEKYNNSISQSRQINNQKI